MNREGLRWLILLGLSTAGVASASCPAHLQFLGNRCSEWQATLLPEALPPSPGNAVADSTAAAALGMRIFYDNRFSQAGSGVSCASCHDPEHAFAERKRTSRTIREVARNAPDLYNAAWYRHSHFWDGKADSLWSAPLFTLEQEDEMGGTRLGVAQSLAAIYKTRYESVFGPLPDLADPARFAPVGKPGTAAFDQMKPADREAVDRVYANVGKALEAYMRKVAAGRAAFDDFLTGHPGSLGPEARLGMLAFTRLGCDACHSGPTFTDEAFHDLGRPEVRDAMPRDPARAGGLVLAASWAFGASSAFADQPAFAVSRGAAGADDPAGFRTPSLRNIADTAPYFHDGAFDTLEQAIAAHVAVLPAQSQPPTAQEVSDLVTFLRSLSGRHPSPPWNYWPGG